MSIGMVAKANDLLTPAPVHGDRRGRRLCSVLVADPLHVLQEHLLAAAVISFVVRLSAWPAIR
jgi:hypothetical protein